MCLGNQLILEILKHQKVLNFKHFVEQVFYKNFLDTPYYSRGYNECWCDLKLHELLGEINDSDEYFFRKFNKFIMSSRSCWTTRILHIFDKMADIVFTC